MNTMRLGLAPILTAVFLSAAPGAAATDHNMRVNEISPGEGFVELLDVLPGGESLNDSYTVRSYDGAGNDVAAQDYTPPTPFADSTVPFVLALTLPADAGQVCFERARNPESTLPLEEYRLHCLGYGQVTNPVVRRMYFGPRPMAMPITAKPGPGESVQRQPCGRAAVAPSTRGAENAEVPAACAGLPVCDDPRKVDEIPPRMRVKLPKVHDVDRPFVVSVTLNEPGDVSLRGSFTVGVPPPIKPGDPNPKPYPGGFLFGPLRADVRANVPARIRIPVSRKAKRLVKRGARRGKETRGGVVTIGRDSACFKNRAHSSRQFRLVP